MNVDASLASRHAMLRWLGAPLFFTGLALVAFALYAWSQGGAGINVGLSLFGTGMGLASFGANNDTAIALALRASEAGPDVSRALQPGLLAELADELKRDRAAVMALHVSPGFAMVVPVIAVGLQVWVASRLFS